MHGSPTAGSLMPVGGQAVGPWQSPRLPGRRALYGGAGKDQLQLSPERGHAGLVPAPTQTAGSRSRLTVK